MRSYIYFIEEFKKSMIPAISEYEICRGNTHATVPALIHIVTMVYQWSTIQALYTD